MQPLDYLAPATIAELQTNLRKSGACILAGGTDLLPQMRAGKIQPSLLVDIHHIPGLRFIHFPESGGSLVEIGACTTWSELEHNPRLRTCVPALVQAARMVGSPMTRARATLGGNLGNASPAADALPPLLVHDAMLTLASENGVRQLSLQDFLLAPGKTALQAGEYIHQINVPVPSAKSASSAFLKLGPRQGMTISIATASAWLELDPRSGLIQNSRIAVGAAAPTAVRCPAAEAALVSHPPSPKVFHDAAQLSRQNMDPIDDVRATRQYRLDAACVLVERVLILAYQQIQMETSR